MRAPLLLSLLFACQGEVECDAAACEGACPPPPPSVVIANGPDQKPLELDEFRWSLYANDLEDLRAGTRPFDERGLGLCLGSECEQFVGLEGGVLPPGAWRVRANLRVPRLGAQPWNVRFRQRCQVDAVGDNPPPPPRDLDVRHDVTYTSETRGTLIDPLAPAVSPDPEGHVRCAWWLDADTSEGRRRYIGRYELPSVAEVRGSQPAPPPAADGDVPAEGDAPADAAPTEPPPSPPSP